MSSPAASASGERKNPAEQITFRFCAECSNMLYPKEDEVERKLMFTCRTCNFSEEATSSCIFRNAMNNAVGETAGVTQDVGSDPTVGGSSPSSFGDRDALDRRDSRSSALSASSNLSTCTISSCLGCGIMIACETCGGHFSMAPATAATRVPELDVDERSITAFDQDANMNEDHEFDVDLDDVEIVPWTGDSLDELGSMVRSADFFGLDDMDVSLDHKPANVPTPSVLHSQVSRALVQG